MKPLLFLIILAVGATIFGCKENTLVKPPSSIIDGPMTMKISDIPAYKPSDPSLNREILAADKTYFDAYNSCDLDTQADMYAEGFEFFHDQGGLETSKEALINALKNNICDKVTRTLVPGSMEIYKIPGYGAVAEGYHSFFNKEEPDAPQKPSKFITIWKQTDAGWKMARIVSLH